tara:strand:- start:80 stop:1351 length:1272 start_codon:yes stop_codon:yes gene_type:complete
MRASQFLKEADPGQEAKQLLNMINTPEIIAKVKDYLMKLVPKKQPQQPQQQAEPVAEDLSADKAFAMQAIDEITKSGDAQQLNAVISFLKSSEIMEEAKKAILANISQGDKGGFSQKLGQMVQSLNAPFEQKIAFFNKMQKGFWDGSDLLNNPSGNIYQKLQADPIMSQLAKPMALQFRGAMGYGPDQGPGEFLLALTGQGVDLADKSDLVIVDGVGVEVKADGSAKSPATGKISRSGGRLYSTSGYGNASSARMAMYKAMTDSGIPAEELKQYGWPTREKGAKYANLNFNAKGVDNMNALFSKYTDRTGVQKIMSAMINSLYIELPNGMADKFINSVGADGSINYKSMMDELIVLAHMYYKHQEGHDKIMVFNTANGDYVMMGDEEQTRKLMQANKIRTNSGLDFFDDRSKGTPQLLTGQLA